jgi:hypothetical protein
VTRGELEARIWAITGRDLTGAAVDALLDVADEYTAGVRSQRPVLRHTSPADLWPVIEVLADALLGDGGAHLPTDHPAITETRAA